MADRSAGANARIVGLVCAAVLTAGTWAQAQSVRDVAYEDLKGARRRGAEKGIWEIAWGAVTSNFTGRTVNTPTNAEEDSLEVIRAEDVVDYQPSTDGGATTGTVVALFRPAEQLRAILYPEMEIPEDVEEDAGGQMPGARFPGRRDAPLDMGPGGTPPAGRARGGRDRGVPPAGFGGVGPPSGVGVRPGRVGEEEEPQSPWWHVEQPAWITVGGRIRAYEEGKLSFWLADMEGNRLTKPGGVTVSRGSGRFSVALEKEDFEKWRRRGEDEETGAATGPGGRGGVGAIGRGTGRLPGGTNRGARGTSAQRGQTGLAELRERRAMDVVEVDHQPGYLPDEMVLSASGSVSFSVEDVVMYRSFLNLYPVEAEEGRLEGVAYRRFGGAQAHDLGDGELEGFELAAGDVELPALGVSADMQMIARIRGPYEAMALDDQGDELRRYAERWKVGAEGRYVSDLTFLNSLRLDAAADGSWDGGDVVRWEGAGEGDYAILLPATFVDVEPFASGSELRFRYMTDEGAVPYAAVLDPYLVRGDFTARIGFVNVRIGEGAIYIVQSNGEEGRIVGRVTGSVEPSRLKVVEGSFRVVRVKGAGLDEEEAQDEREVSLWGDDLFVNFGPTVLGGLEEIEEFLVYEASRRFDRLALRWAYPRDAEGDDYAVTSGLERGDLFWGMGRWSRRVPDERVRKEAEIALMRMPLSPEALRARAGGRDMPGMPGGGMPGMPPGAMVPGGFPPGIPGMPGGPPGGLMPVGPPPGAMGPGGSRPPGYPGTPGGPPGGPIPGGPPPGAMMGPGGSRPPGPPGMPGGPPGGTIPGGPQGGRPPGAADPGAMIPGGPGGGPPGMPPGMVGPPGMVPGGTGAVEMDMTAMLKALTDMGDMMEMGEEVDLTPQMWLALPYDWEASRWDEGEALLKREKAVAFMQRRIDLLVKYGMKAEVVIGDVWPEPSLEQNPEYRAEALDFGQKAIVPVEMMDPANDEAQARMLENLKSLLRELRGVSRVIIEDYAVAGRLGVRGPRDFPLYSEKALTRFRLSVGEEGALLPTEAGFPTTERTAPAEGEKVKDETAAAPAGRMGPRGGAARAGARGATEQEQIALLEALLKAAKETEDKEGGIPQEQLALMEALLKEAKGEIEGRSNWESWQRWVRELSTQRVREIAEAVSDAMSMEEAFEGVTFATWRHGVGSDVGVDLEEIAAIAAIDTLCLKDALGSQDPDQEWWGRVARRSGKELITVTQLYGRDLAGVGEAVLEETAGSYGTVVQKRLGDGEGAVRGLWGSELTSPLFVNFGTYRDSRCGTGMYLGEVDEALDAVWTADLGRDLTRDILLEDVMDKHHLELRQPGSLARRRERAETGEGFSAEELLELGEEVSLGGENVSLDGDFSEWGSADVLSAGEVLFQLPGTNATGGLARVSVQVDRMNVYLGAAWEGAEVTGRRVTGEGCLNGYRGADVIEMGVAFMQKGRPLAAVGEGALLFTVSPPGPDGQGAQVFFARGKAPVEISGVRYRVARGEGRDGAFVVEISIPYAVFGISPDEAQVLLVNVAAADAVEDMGWQQYAVGAGGKLPGGSTEGWKALVWPTEEEGDRGGRTGPPGAPAGRGRR